MRRILLSFAALGAMSGSALAVTPVPVMTWQGFYVGASTGYGWSSGDLSAGSNSLHEFTRGFGYGFAESSAVGTSHNNSGGWFGGVHGGYNVQQGMFVYGLEGDINFSRLNIGSAAAHTLAVRVGEDEWTSGLTTANANINWFGSLRARLGVAHNNFLVYVTGGLAFGEVELNGHVHGDFSFDNGADLRAVGRSFYGGSSIQSGWTAGFGFDYLCRPGFSIGAFYQYVNLGTVSGRTRFMEERIFGGGQFYDRGTVRGSASVDADFHLVGVRLSVQLGGPR